MTEETLVDAYLKSLKQNEEETLSRAEKQADKKLKEEEKEDILEFKTIDFSKLDDDELKANFDYLNAKYFRTQYPDLRILWGRYFALCGEELKRRGYVIGLCENGFYYNHF